MRDLTGDEIKRIKERLRFCEDWEDHIGPNGVFEQRRMKPVNVDYVSFVAQQMALGKIPDVPHVRETCNRCLDSKPLLGQAWCGRCAIKHNLKLRHVKEFDFDAIKRTISLLKRFMRPEETHFDKAVGE